MARIVDCLGGQTGHLAERLTHSMRYLYCLILLLFVQYCSWADIFDRANLFGSMQNMFLYEKSDCKLSLHRGRGQSDFDSTIYDYERSSFALQQLDLFVAKEISDDFKMFIDLELKLNFSSEDNWGQAKVQEAWAEYSASDLFNLRAGILFPKFNNMNEIKNKSFLPYAIKPIVYDQMFSNDRESDYFIPDRAYLEAYGFYPIHNIRLEYALYAGNSSKDYISNNTSNDTATLKGGLDTKGLEFKLFGGRIGIRKDDEKFKAGISFTKDKEKVYLDFQSIKYPVSIKDDIDRYRLGLDLSFSVWKFDSESEMVNVMYDFEDPQNPWISLNRMFLYSTLLYNATDKFFGYFCYQYTSHKTISEDNSYTYSLGCGYKFNDAITLKMQYINYSYEQVLREAPFSISGSNQFFATALNVCF